MDIPKLDEMVSAARHKVRGAALGAGLLALTACGPQPKEYVPVNVFFNQGETNWGQIQQLLKPGREAGLRRVDIREVVYQSGQTPGYDQNPDVHTWGVVAIPKDYAMEALTSGAITYDGTTFSEVTGR